MNVAPLKDFFNIVFEPLSGTTLISFASSEFAIKQMTRNVVTVHYNDIPHPAKLSLKQHSFDVGGVGALQDFQIGDTVLLANSLMEQMARMWSFQAALFFCSKVSKFHIHIVEMSRSQHCTLSVL